MPPDSDSLQYHARKPAGKISITPTKPLRTRKDLGLAYTPGVAEPVLAIAADPAAAYAYTSKGNLVAVISNGTAVLGLGNTGALASKPVMEGKAVLFKAFAGVNAIDIEVEERDPAKLIEIIAAIAPSFGGINLEDIKAPECFLVEEALKKRLPIPVFHDDQHGTAVVVAAALENALMLQEKAMESISVVINGAGAASLAIARFLIGIGLPKWKLVLCDTKGVVYEGRRENMNEYKKQYASPTPSRTLAEALRGADVFIGVSAANAVTPEMLKGMAPKPIVFAMANPDPEIPYGTAKHVRPDAIVATGRSDFPNQVNNVLCFPFLFRGALDARASAINQEMKLAAAKAIAALAREPVPKEVLQAYGISSLAFGPEYILPKPFDRRLLTAVAPAVSAAARASGATSVATDRGGAAQR